MDVNNPIFLEGLFELGKNDRHAVLNTLCIPSPGS